MREGGEMSIRRLDGRKKDEMRKVTIKRRFIKYAEGSCLIELGNTRVICAATLEESVPTFLRGTQTGWVTAEYGMLPRSCPNRIPRERSSGRNYEIQRLIGRSLRAVIEMRELGERTIWLDCDVIQADGGTRTAAITGSFVALVDCLNKLRRNGQVEKLPIKDFIAATSVGIISDEPILDLTYEEDSRAEVDMNVVMTGQGEFIEVQGTAEGKPFSKTRLDQLVSLAKKGIEELVDIQRNSLKDIL
jgi:ribonuclease PH